MLGFFSGITCLNDLNMIISPAISIYDDGQKHDLVPGGGSKIMAEPHELAPAILRACSSALYQETSMKKMSTVCCWSGG